VRIDGCHAISWRTRTLIFQSKIIGSFDKFRLYVISINYVKNSMLIELTYPTFFSLGARHDDENNNNCSSFERYVMAPSVGATTSEKGTNHYIFSNCSVDYFQTYIDYMDT
jgi:hypothetical protein